MPALPPSSTALHSCSQDVLTTALETSGCGTFVFEAEAASVAERWAKLAAFRALLIDGEALVELGGRQVPSCTRWPTWRTALHQRGLLGGQHRTPPS